MGVERGSRLGSYELVQWIAFGTQAEVWAAAHIESRQEVAIKIVATTTSSAARFLREIETLSEVTHPSIVRIQDTGTLENGRAWYAMPRYAGTLRDHLERRGTLSPREAARTLAPIAGALSAVHRHHIIHRDIKPSNILRSASGRPFLADFGVISREDGQSLTKTGFVIGSPTFLAPEVLSGDAAHAGSDAYSFGVIAFLSVTGVTPGDDVGTQMSAAGVDSEFAAVVTQLLDPDPATRLTDLTLAASALENIATPRRSAGAAPRRAARPARRTVEAPDAYPSAMGTYAIVLATLLVVFGVAALSMVFVKI